MVKNHDYETPDHGSDDWHIPLNNNFNHLDVDIEVRGVDGDQSQYQPKAGSKFLATDTGCVYVGDGSEWRQIRSTGNDPSFDSAAVGVTNGTDNSIDLEPLVDSLREGYVVGVSNKYQTVVDPRDYSSDAAAIQAANDDLTANLSQRGPSGYVYLPALRPDGTELTIGNTVVFGSETAEAHVLPRGWGYSGAGGPKIQCTIDNGDPMFVVASDSANGGSVKANGTWLGGFAAQGHGNDAEFLRIKNGTAFHLKDVNARHFNSATADGVYVFDGSCYNSYINNTTYVASQIDCPDADVWVLRDDTGNGPPGELKFGPANSTYADPSYPFNSAFRCEVNANDIAWGGRIEGAGGDGLIYQTGGDLYLTGYTELGRVEGSGTDKVYFDGYMLCVSPVISLGSNLTGSSGHGLHIPSIARGYIPPLANDGIDGDVIHIENDNGSSNYVVVPYPGTFNGSVRYPEPRWNQLVYPDGWQKYREGTTTIQADTITTLTAFAGGPGTKLRLTDLTIASDPGGDARFHEVWGWSSGSGSDGKQWVGIEETNGTSFELEWKIHKKLY